MADSLNLLDGLVRVGVVANVEFARMAGGEVEGTPECPATFLVAARVEQSAGAGRPGRAWVSRSEGRAPLVRFTVRFWGKARKLP